MERTGGKWVPISQYARRRRISKSTIYRRVRNGELTKRLSETGAEIFITGEDLERFEADAVAPKGASDKAESESTHIDLELDAEDAYSIADQTLRTMIAMHKEVLAEKSRMLEEWESELKRREERLEELVGALSGKEAMLLERTTEARELRRALRHKDELIKEHERALLEYRRLQEQRDEIERFADASREELMVSLAEKDKLLDEKERILEELRHTLGQRQDVYHESSRIVEELTKALRDTKQIIAEKDEMLSRLSTEPTDIEGKIRARDQTISELRMLIKTLEDQIDMKSHARDLTGFSEESGPETGALIQDQLEYLMQSESSEKYMEESVAPDDSLSTEEKE